MGDKRGRGCFIPASFLAARLARARWRGAGLRPLALAGLALALLPGGWAAAAELGRPVASALRADHGGLYLRGGYMSQRLDVLNYAASAPGSAKLDHFQRLTGGFRYALTDAVNAMFEARWTDQLALRSTQPLRVPSLVASQKAGLQVVLRRDTAFPVALEAGYLHDKARDESVYRYDFGGFHLSRLGGLPLFTLRARDSGWYGAVRGRWDVSRRFRLHLGGELRRYTVSAQMVSDSASIRALLKSRAPQDTPWRAYHAWLRVGLDWRITRHWLLAMDYGRLQVSRRGYVARAGKPDISNADRLDGYLVWSWRNGLAFPLHGRAQTHFLLGDMPLLYNTTSNHKYTKAFGFLSAGVSWNF